MGDSGVSDPRNGMEDGVSVFDFSVENWRRIGRIDVSLDFLTFDFWCKAYCRTDPE